ncbi:MAG: NAD-dependent epimerase/dehydratase family protein [Proteobacteria bacterium]|nr:NAD-dependent epimerase/dehydratase family protein [Pseudomonadota bacterium]
MQAPTALVTGAGGFTGRYLVPALRDKEFRVVGLGEGASSADVDISCNLTNTAAVRSAVEQAQPTHVVHLAALAFVGHGDARAFYDVNLFGTLNLLEALAALDVPPQKVLIASSANVYGTPGVEVIDETVCPAPVNHYACSKLAMEHMVRTWFERLPIVMTRPFNYTGVGQDEKFLIPKIVSHFQRNAAHIELGNLDVARDFSDVRDVAAAYMALLDSDAHSDVFNVCTGEAVALREVLRMMAEISAHDLEVRVNPAFVRSNEIPVLRGDPRKLQGQTGHTSSIPLRDTLHWMYTAASPAA